MRIAPIAALMILAAGPAFAQAADPASDKPSTTVGGNSMATPSKTVAPTNDGTHAHVVDTPSADSKKSKTGGNSGGGGN